jgi:hypothetical protein
MGNMPSRSPLTIRGCYLAVSAAPPGVPRFIASPEAAGGRQGRLTFTSTLCGVEIGAGISEVPGNGTSH